MEVHWVVEVLLGFDDVVDGPGAEELVGLEFYFEAGLLEEALVAEHLLFGQVDLAVVEVGEEED
jgi:hypothetical protein